jgi:hypothetical protein
MIMPSEIRWHIEPNNAPGLNKYRKKEVALVKLNL